MKKIFFLILLSAVTMSVWPQNLCDDDREYVKIEKETEVIEEERSLSYLDCYIYRSQRILEVSYADVGILNVFIYDHNNNLVDCEYGFESCDKLILSLPLREGQYMVFIQSDTFSGKGYFVVY